MTCAIESVRNGMKIKMAAAYALPPSALRDRLNGAVPTQGRQKKFTVEEEAKIVDLLKSLAKLGIPFNQHTLIKLVKEISVKKGMLCADLIGRFCSDLSSANSKFIAGVDASKFSRNWQRGFLTDIATCLFASHQLQIPRK